MPVKQGTTKQILTQRWAITAATVAAIGIGVTTVPGHADETSAAASSAQATVSAAQTTTTSQATLSSSSAVSSAASSEATPNRSATASSATSSAVTKALSSAETPVSSGAVTSTAQPGSLAANSTATVSSSAAAGSGHLAASSVAASVAATITNDAQGTGQGTASAGKATVAQAAQQATATSLQIPVAPTVTAAATAAKTPAYADSSVFDWQLNADGTATITGVTQQVTGTLNLPPTYTVNGQTYTVTGIGAAAFASQTGLTDGLTGVVFANGLITIGDSAFAYLPNLQLVDFSANQTLQTIGREAFVADGLTQLVLPASVTSIGEAAFTYNNTLTTVTLPAALTSLGDTAFASCAQLTSVDLTPATGLTTITAHAFENDPLTTLVIPANIQTIGEAAFANNVHLTTLTFAPASQLTTIEKDAFIYDCELTDLVLPDAVTTIGDQAFLANAKLATLTLGAGLQTIGVNAFTYDNALTTVDWAPAQQLQTIGAGAFEYDSIMGDLPVLASLTTIGEAALAGNQLNSVVFGDQLVTIGDAAFSFNHLTGSLVVPETVTSVGERAFYGNELTAATVGDATTLGVDALSYNRLTTLHGPTVSDIVADEQLVTTFKMAPDTLPLTDLFDLNLGGQTTADLTLSNLTNGVTLVNGQLIIPQGTDRFTFDWALPLTTGATAYSGTYTVILDNPDIKVTDSTIFAGSTWTPSDNFVSAVTPQGDDLTLDQLTTVGNVDTTQAGTYQVTYQYLANGAVVSAQTATVTVLKRTATYRLTGSSTTTYTGQTPTLDGSGYRIVLPDGTICELTTGDLDFTGTATAPTAVGTYAVGLSAAGQAKLAAQPASQMYDWVANTTGATATITPAPVTITPNNVVVYVGETPTLTATVSGQPVDGVPVDYTFAPVTTTTAGYQDIQVILGANPNYTVTLQPGRLTVLASQQTLLGTDYTWTIGDPAPTAADFNASATDKTGAAILVTVDLSQAELTQAGDYPVTLTTSDGQTKTVTLHVVAATTGGDTGGGNGAVTPGEDPDQGVDPDTPSSPDPTPVVPDPAPTPTTPGSNLPADKSTDGETHRVIGDAAVPKTVTGSALVRSLKTNPRLRVPGSTGTSTTSTRQANGYRGHGVQSLATSHGKTTQLAKSKTNPTTPRSTIKVAQATVLPQTNENPLHGRLWAAIGLILGALGLKRFRRHTDE